MNALQNGLASLAAVLAGVAVAGGLGCGDSSAPGNEAQRADPTAAVSRAGKKTFREATLSLTLRVASAGGRYEAAGLIEPGDGRFRVQVGAVSPPNAYAPEHVVGLEGEGVENTVAEIAQGPLGNGSERCWFNPHAPVGGFLGTASVEESARVTGAVLESLGNEVRSVEPADGPYEVVLDESATRPRDDFHDTEKRVWGDRNLLAQLAGPIEVALSPAGTVDEIAVELRDYEPYEVGFAGDERTGPIPKVTIAATLAPTDEKLVVDPPECQAIE
jgi:hypothetical protein